MPQSVLYMCTRWEVQEREADENALTIPLWWGYELSFLAFVGLYVSEQLMERKRKKVKALLWAMFGCTVYVPVALEWIARLKHLCGEWYFICFSEDYGFYWGWVNICGGSSLIDHLWL
nr:hypothetical protein [Tanacetum cinerariifolium]